MSFKKFGLAIFLFATAGFMACGDDSSSSFASDDSALKAPSYSDSVTCKFKEEDDGLAFTATVTIKNENAGETDTILITGSCNDDKEGCMISKKTGAFTETAEGLPSGPISEEAQTDFKSKKDNYKEDCDYIDGKNRLEYVGYTDMISSVSCDKDHMFTNAKVAFMDEDTAKEYFDRMSNSSKKFCLEYNR